MEMSRRSRLGHNCDQLASHNLEQNLGSPFRKLPWELPCPLLGCRGPHEVVGPLLMLGLLDGFGGLLPQGTWLGVLVAGILSRRCTPYQRIKK